MADRTFESASIARRRLEEEFDRNVPNRTSGLFTWIGIGGLFGSVFVVCGGIGVLLGGRELMTRDRAPSDGPGPSEAALIREVTPIGGATPAPVPPSVVGEPAGAAEPPEREADEPSANVTPPVRPAPDPAPRRVRPRPKPRPEPAPAEPEPDPTFDAAPLDVETDDLIDPWKP